jgi:prepilin-type N-terminal cleavage/methylation domain-containing protein
MRMIQNQFSSLVCRGRVGCVCLIHRRGFTFTEVMFAVILLGIGFIMLAGMFPVAIQQTQTNVEESTASTVVQAAARYLEESMTMADLAPTGDLSAAPPVYPQFLRLSQRFDRAANPTWPHLIDDHALWQKTRGGFILPQDPRFAWTALYKRNPGDNFAQVIIFAMQSRNQTTYSSAPVSPSGFSDLDPIPVTGSTVSLASFEPRFLQAIISDSGDPALPDIIEFTDIGAGMNVLRDAVAEGCFVVVSNDQIQADEPNTPHFDPGSANGRIYRVGVRRADLDGSGSIAWELMPGHDMFDAEENLPSRTSTRYGASTGLTDHNGDPPATVFIVGRGFLDISPVPPDTTFTGFAQDIAVYSTFIRLK